jgi:hypothetical protein
MLGSDGGRHQAEHVGLEVELGQRDRSDAVLAAEHVGERILVDEGELEKDRGQGFPASLLLGGGELEALGTDQTFGDEELAQARRTSALARRFAGQTYEPPRRFSVSVKAL